MLHQLTCTKYEVHGCAGVPEIPERPTIRERARGVEVRWTEVGSGSPGGASVSNESTGPLVYIVDSRWNIGRQQNDADMTPWQQVAQVSHCLLTFYSHKITIISHYRCFQSSKLYYRTLPFGTYQSIVYYAKGSMNTGKIHKQ